MVVIQEGPGHTPGVIGLAFTVAIIIATIRYHNVLSRRMRISAGLICAVAGMASLLYTVAPEYSGKLIHNTANRLPALPTNAIRNYATQTHSRNFEIKLPTQSGGILITRDYDTDLYVELDKGGYISIQGVSLTFSQLKAITERRIQHHVKFRVFIWADNVAPGTDLNSLIQFFHGVGCTLYRVVIDPQPDSNKTEYRAVPIQSNISQPSKNTDENDAAI
jgi:hypothetical protein